MLNLGTVRQGATIFIPFSTNDAAGAAVGFSATIEAADFDIYKDGSVTQRSSSAGITVLETFDSVTGLHGITIDLSDNTDAGFYAAGSVFDVSLTPDETVDLQTVAKWIARFRIESNAEKGVRLLQELYSAHTVGATGNDTTHVHLDGIAAAQGDDELIGELLLLFDVSASEWHFARTTDYANTGDLATVESLQGGALPFTPASGDYWFRVGHFTAKVVAMEAGVVTAAAIATGAIDADALAADAITAGKIAADAIGASELATDAVNEIVAAVFARAFEATKMSGLTFEEVVGLMASVLLGKASGLATATATYRNPGDSANAVVATVDADGNRSAVTLTAASVR